VLIIDNHPIVREGLRRVIDGEGDLFVCAESDTAREARIAVRRRNTYVKIADIGLNQGDGIELVRDVRAHYPGCRSVLSRKDDLRRTAVVRGANGHHEACHERRNTGVAAAVLDGEIVSHDVDAR
jgi:DNA-binding NarL/FixJ family response regulator